MKAKSITILYSSGLKSSRKREKNRTPVARKNVARIVHLTLNRKAYKIVTRCCYRNCYFFFLH